MDYIERSSFFVWEDLNDCLKKINKRKVYSISTKGKTVYTKPDYKKNDAFIFGPVKVAIFRIWDIPMNIINLYSSVTIPMNKKGRSLNLANAVSVIVYEAWRQNGFN